MKWIRDRKVRATKSSPVGEATQFRSHLRDEYLRVEGSIHRTEPASVVDGYWRTWEANAWYEDGIATLRNDVFRRTQNFTIAYNAAIRDATALGLDPHIRWRAHIFESLLRSARPGTRLELGTAHGFMFYFALTKHKLDGCLEAENEIILIDKFNQNSVDSVSGELLDRMNVRYANGFETVRSAFRAFPNVRIEQGTVPEVLSNLDLATISFLHLDLNAANPEAEALQQLWPKLTPGALVLLDDYGFLEFVPSQIVHDQLASRLGKSVCLMPTGQGLLIK